MLSSFSLTDSTIGFIIDGPFNDESIEKIQSEVVEKLELFEKLNFYIEDTPDAEISLKAIIRSLPFKLKTASRFNKVAVVTDRKWLLVVTALERLLLNAKLRHFTSERRLEAIQWISH